MVLVLKALLLVALVTFTNFKFTYAWSSPYSAKRVSIVRQSLKFGTVISARPGNSIWKIARSNPELGSLQISDIIYIPSFLDREAYDPLDLAVDDEFFTSILCDKGFIVHTVVPRKSEDYVRMLSAFVYQLIHGETESGGDTYQSGRRISARNIAVVGHELSCSHLLTYLSEIALPMTLSRVDIGAVVLLDCPPLHALQNRKRRQQILSRYLQPLLCYPDVLDRIVKKKEQSDNNTIKKKKRPKSWKKRQQLKQQEEQDEIDFWKKLSPHGPFGNSPEEQIEGYINYLQKKGEDTERMLTHFLLQRSDTNNRKETESSSLFIGIPNEAVPFSQDEGRGNIQDVSFLENIDEINTFRTLSFDGRMEERLWRLRRKPDVYKTYREKEEENSIEDILISYNRTLSRREVPEDFTQKLISKYPIRIKEMSLAMKNRILMVATDNIRNEQATTTVVDFDHEYDSRDDWGYDSMEEIANVLQAGPVIYTDDLEDDEMLSIVNDGDVDNYSSMDIFASRHLKIANILADWFHMLPRFGYL